MRILSVLAVLLVAVWSPLGRSAGATYPNRHITLVAPIAPGGPLDVNARLIATALSDVLGRQVVVENRPGAGTAVGTASVARAAPDGYTLLLADLTTVVGPSLVANLSYDPQRDFVPVALVSRSFMLLVVNPSFEAKSVSDLVALAKRKPGELQMAHAGVGTPPHLAAVAFTRAADAEHDAGLLSRRQPGPCRCCGRSCSDDFHRRQCHGTDGEGRQGPRARADRDAAHAGFPGCSDVQGKRRSISAASTAARGSGSRCRKGTPAPVIEKLNAAVNQALKDPKVRARYDAADFVMVGGSPEEFGAFMQSQQKFWRDELEAAGFRPQ